MKEVYGLFCFYVDDGSFWRQFFFPILNPFTDTNLIPGELVHFLQAKRLGIIDNFFQERLSDDIVAFLAGAGWNEAYVFRKKFFKIFLLPGINLVYSRPFRKVGHYPREYFSSKANSFLK